MATVGRQLNASSLNVPSIRPKGRRTIRQSDSNTVDEKDMDYACGEPMPDSCSAISPTIKVYVRLRNPQNTSSPKQDAYTILNPNTLVTKLPLDAKYSQVKAFTCDRIFSAETAQADLFGQSIEPQVFDFLNGQSSTIMSYGITNSGKTYTFFGTVSSPGIIPRSIDLIFSTIDCAQFPAYKPTQGSSVIALNEPKCALETGRKDRLLTSRNIEKVQSARARKSLENIGEKSGKKDQSNRSNRKNPSKQSGESTYSFWMSFAEIYKETVYDLLLVDKQDQHFPLDITSDSDGKPYVRGLRSVYATTAYEACQLVMAGQSRMSTASTASNPKNSRSHTILSFTLLKYGRRNRPQEVKVSTLTFCDLAGSVQWESTCQGRDRVNEARSINNSHLVLGRCIKAVHDIQSSRQKVDHVAGPFRESKLTRLFQRAIAGQENLTLMINIDLSSKLYHEIRAILDVAKMLKKISESMKVSKRTSALNTTFVQCRNTSHTSLSKHQIDETTGKSDNELNAKNERLKLYPEEMRNDDYIRNIAVYRRGIDQYFDTIKKLLNDSKRGLSELDRIKRHAYTSKIVSEESVLIDEESFVNRLIKDTSVLIEVAKNLNNAIQIARCKCLAQRLIGLGKTTHAISIELSEKPQDSLVAEPEQPKVTKKVDNISRQDFGKLEQKNQKLTEEIEELKGTALNRECKVREELANYYSSIIKDLEESWKERAKEIEAENQDLLKWSVKQVENFYKERIDNMIGNRKRKRVYDDDRADEERFDYDELEQENVRNTSKIVVLKDTIQKLKADNDAVSAEKNRYSFELGLLKDELKSFQDLAKYEFNRDLSKESDTVEATCLVQKLKSLIEDKRVIAESMERKLVDTRNKFTEIYLASKEVIETLANMVEMWTHGTTAKDGFTDGMSEKRRQFEALVAKFKCQKTKLVEVLRTTEGEVNGNVEESTKTNIMEESDEQLQIPPIPRIVNYFEDTFFEQDQSASFEKKGVNNETYEFSPNYFLFGDEVPDPPSIVTQAHVDFKKGRNALATKEQVGKKAKVRATDVEHKKSCDSIGRDTFRSSDYSSKDDSGIGELSHRSRRSLSVSESTKIHETDDKETQTCVVDEVAPKQNEQEPDSVNLTVESSEEPCILNLSQELENVKEELRVSKCTLAVFERELTSRDEIIEQLLAEKDSMKLAHDEVTRDVEQKLTEHAKFGELSSDLIFTNHNESQGSKYFKSYLKKHLSMDGQLNTLDSRNAKSVSDIQHVCRHDSFDGFETDPDCRKVENFKKNEDDKNGQITRMTYDRDITDLNEHNAKDETGGISVYPCNKFGVQDNFWFKELEKRIEASSTYDINDLKCRLKIIENDNIFLNFLRTRNENELCRLKSELRTKDKEIYMIKENRDMAIRHYQSLVKLLEDEIHRSKRAAPMINKVFSFGFDDSVKTESSDDIVKNTKSNEISQDSGSIVV